MLAKNKRKKNVRSMKKKVRRGVVKPVKSGRLADKAVLKKPDLKGIVGETVGFEHHGLTMPPQVTTVPADSITWLYPKKVPCCKGCGREFNLLTAMGIKEVDMYCRVCEIERATLQKVINEYHELDRRIKKLILPKVKGYSWMEQTKC